MDSVEVVAPALVMMVEEDTMHAESNRYEQMVAKSLLTWADELDSGKWRQIRGGWSDDAGGRCPEGLWYEVIHGESVHGYEVAHPLIVEEVHRLVPRSRTYNNIPALNDESRVPFSVFARAARNVAYREQEQSFGAPIVMAEDAREALLV